MIWYQLGCSPKTRELLTNTPGLPFILMVIVMLSHYISVQSLGRILGVHTHYTPPLHTSVLQGMVLPGYGKMGGSCSVVAN